MTQSFTVICLENIKNMTKVNTLKIMSRVWKMEGINCIVFSTSTWGLKKTYEKKNNSINTFSGFWVPWSWNKFLISCYWKKNALGGTMKLKWQKEKPVCLNNQLGTNFDWEKIEDNSTSQLDSKLILRFKITDDLFGKFILHRQNFHSN